MNECDNEFFEEYKRLNKLCSDLYMTQNGVSEYIAQMKLASAQGLRVVRAWAYDRHMLEHVRSVRNAIAHDTAGYQVSKDEDIEFVCDFYERIMSCTDPLALLRKSTEAMPPSRRRGTGRENKEKHDHMRNTSSSGSAMQYYDAHSTGGSHQAGASHQNGGARYVLAAIITAAIVTAATLIGLLLLTG